jgi:phosphoribosylformimino-5-aminoimidazole carboxamide ribotide isomerase
VIAIPALDLQGGACVQLAAGSYDEEVIRIPDVLGVEAAWRLYGFHHLQVIDLDATTGRGSNTELIRTILDRTEADIQVGGGVRTREAIQELLAGGAERVIIGNRALEDPEWLADMSSLFPGSIIVAADVRDRNVLAKGWARARALPLLDLVDELNRFQLGGLIVAASSHDEMTAGSHLSLVEDAVEGADFPVMAAGPFAGISDLRSIADRGVAGAIIGMALYTGALDPRTVAEEFAE